MKLTKALCMLATSIAPAFAGASVYSAHIKPYRFTTTRDYSRGLDASTIQPIESLKGLKYADVQQMIPTDLDPNSPQNIGRRILDTTVKSAMQSQALKNTSVMRTAQSVQQSLQGGVSMGSREPNSINHDLRFAADPAQELARINYSGLTHAQLSYRANESKMDFEVREPVHMLQTDVVYNHTNVPGESKDLMSLRWSW